MARNITLPTAVDLSTASTDLFFTTAGATATYLPTGGWNGGNAVEFTPPNMYPPPFPNGNQGYSALGNFILVERPQVVFTRWMFWGSPDYFLDSRWAAEPGQKAFMLRRFNGADGEDRVMVAFHGYGPGEFDLAICNGINCDFLVPRFPLHEHMQGKWICFEVEANLQTGMKRLYVTTADGAYRNFLWQAEALAPGAPTWGDIDFIGFFNGPIDMSIPGFSFKMSDIVISNQFIGPPPGFGERRRRYYVSRRIGTGIPGANDSYRCEAHDWLGRNFPGQQNMVGGFVSSICAWTLCAYELTTAAHDGLLAALPNTRALPDVPLSTTWGSLSTPVRNAISNKLDAAGFDMTWVANTTTIGEILNYVLHSMQFAKWTNTQIGNKLFDVRRKTIGDLTPDKWAAIQERASTLGVNLTGLASTAALAQVAERFVSVRLRDGKSPLQNS